MTHRIALDGITCVGYVRVSTEEQAGEKQTSLADQRRAIAALAAKLGQSLGHIFEDAGLSGSSIEHRPGMRALVASCESHPARQPSYVLALNDSRWGRFPDPEESSYWRHHLARVGWIVRFAEMDDVDDKFLRPVLRAMVQSQASLYRETLKANVLRGTRGQAEQGYWQAKAPFGFARQVVYPPGRERVLPNHVPKAKDEKIILTPDPVEAPIVRAVFDRYVAGGESLTSLLEWAEASYPSRPWTRAAMLRMLTNPAVVGDVVWGRVGVEPGRKRVTRDDSAFYGKRDAHEPIVPRELFAAAQQRLAHNRQRTRGVRSDWILSGLVACRCGRYLVGGGMAGAGPVYACSSRGAHRSRRCAYGGAVTKRLLEETLIATIGKELRSAVHRRAMAAALEQADAVARKRVRSVDEIARELATAEQRRQRLVSAVESGTLTPVEVRDRMDAVRREIATLTAERETAAVARGRGAAEREQLVTQALDFGTMVQTLEAPKVRELLSAWIERAEFNTETRELMIEIRRVPSAAIGQPLSGFATERERSATKSTKGATVVRRVIVRRQVA